MKKSEAATHRAQVFYTGRVQGVGFRYTTEAIAHRIGLKGYVKNLSDQRVELVCEGSKKKIEELLDEIKKCSLGPYIQKVDCRWEEPTQNFDDFRVEFQL